MEQIISKIYELLKDTNNLVQLLMYDTFAKLDGDVFSQINHVIKEQKQADSWTVERNDKKSIQFIFGEVRYNRTLMHDNKGVPRYPLDEWLGFRKHQTPKPFRRSESG